ncbi:MAG: transposase [Chlorobiota bacterium]|nr:transposase [Chlorobiota bacterium]QQS67209.1 MAG: transposase [Chlorobiota bacterium]
MTQSEELITLTFDDTIEEKRYTDESELNCWHIDHVFGRSVKGVNFITALIEVGGMRLPVGVEFVKKDLWEDDPKTGNPKRKSSKTKNEIFREILRDCTNKMHFNYVLADSWYSSVENIIC